MTKDEFFRLLGEHKVLTAGIPPAVLSAATALWAAIDKDAPPVIGSAAVTVALFKVAYIPPSIDALLEEWRKNPSERSLRVLCQAAGEVIGLAAAAGLAFYVPESSAGIILTASVLSSIATRVASPRDAVATTAFAAAAGAVGVIATAVEDKLFWTGIAGAILTFGFGMLDLPDALARKTMSVVLANDMLVSGVLQLAATFISSMPPQIFPITMGLIGIGAGLLAVKLLVIAHVEGQLNSRLSILRQ